jgi:hypothetical protein
MIKKLRNSLLLLCLIIYIILSSVACTYPVNGDKLSYRDSIAFDYSIKYIIRNKLIRTLNWKSDYDHSVFMLYFIKMYQSPDSLKSAIIMVGRLPKEENNPLDKNYLFCGRIIYGIRNSKDDVWELYPAIDYAPSGWPTKEVVVSMLENYLHNIIKTDTKEIPNPKMTKNEVLDSMIPIDKRIFWVHNKYTIDDPEFWTKSIYFWKDLRANGYYMFQTYHHFPHDDQIIKYTIEYPDSILKMYGKSKSDSINK